MSESEEGLGFGGKEMAEEILLLIGRISTIHWWTWRIININAVIVMVIAKMKKIMWNIGLVIIKETHTRGGKVWVKKYYGLKE